MSAAASEAGAAHPPLFWYAVPHGYLRVDLHPTEEGLAEVVRQLRALPEDLRRRAEQVLLLYAGVVSAMQRENVLGCAVGMHPDDEGAPSVSVLTLSSVPLHGDDPLRTLTRMMADSRTGAEFQPVELSAGVGFVTERERRVPSPRQVADTDQPTTERVWQGVVAIPNRTTGSAVTVQLVTPSVHLAAEYRSILLGVAHTVSFTDPHAPGPRQDGGAADGSDAPKVRDVFG